MSSTLARHAADHRRLLELAARQAGFADPVAVDASAFLVPLLKAARRSEILPAAGVLIRDWDPDGRRSGHGLYAGVRLYEVEGVRFAGVAFRHSEWYDYRSLNFLAVDRADYRRLYRISVRLRRDAEPRGEPPILPEGQAERLWANTIGYLERAHLALVRRYGGRPRRGVLLTGPPGNGKTTACRWIWEECRRRCWEWRLVTPDAYREARRRCNAREAVKELFTVGRRGVVFFDDMDAALRDRDAEPDSDDQAVFLGALDGIEVREGAVYVFTTNCPLPRIDRAFNRPGRIDLVMQFGPPDAALRHRLMERWHEEMRTAIDLDRAAAETDGLSFAEVEELRNLLVMHFAETGRWGWDRALRQFAANREPLAARARTLGFAACNGDGATS